MYSSADWLIMCVSRRIARSRKTFKNLSISILMFEPGGFLMSLFCIADSNAVVLVSDTGDIGWDYRLYLKVKGWDSW